MHEDLPQAAQIIAFRNRLINGYASVSNQVVWGILEGHLPELAAKVQRVLGKATAGRGRLGSLRLQGDKKGWPRTGARRRPSPFSAPSPGRMAGVWVDVRVPHQPAEQSPDTYPALRQHVLPRAPALSRVFPRTRTLLTQRHLLAN